MKETKTKTPQACVQSNRIEPKRWHLFLHYIPNGKYSECNVTGVKKNSGLYPSKPRNLKNSDLCHHD